MKQTGMNTHHEIGLVREQLDLISTEYARRLREIQQEILFVNRDNEKLERENVCLDEANAPQIRRVQQFDAANKELDIEMDHLERQCMERLTLQREQTRKILERNEQYQLQLHSVENGVRLMNERISDKRQEMKHVLGEIKKDSDMLRKDAVRCLSPSAFADNHTTSCRR